MSFETLEVNFYGNPITVLIPPEGEKYVLLDELLAGLDLSIVDVYNPNKHRVSELGGRVICPHATLNGLLFELKAEEVNPELREMLVVYQEECATALKDYWNDMGIAINRRENPSDITSKFRDDRALSRPLLVRYAGAYAKAAGSDPDQVFNKALNSCYDMAMLDAKGEYETLTGLQAKWLAFVERSYAQALKHCATWQQLPEDVDAYAREHVLKHLAKFNNHGQEMFLKLADSVPASMYH